MNSEAIKKRIEISEKEVKAHRQEMAECQQRLQQLPNLIVGKEYSLIELRKLSEGE